jgi:hypothetical protein
MLKPIPIPKTPNHWNLNLKTPTIEIPKTPNFEHQNLNLELLNPPW